MSHNRLKEISLYGFEEKFIKKRALKILMLLFIVCGCMSKCKLWFHSAIYQKCHPCEILNGI